ncbi:MAG: nucleoside triphosphate pyrophosphatase [Candidatus Babeliales bacterium]
MPHTLFLGSTSAARQQLLKEAQIPFILVTQSADETQCDWNLPWQEVIEKISLYKMEHVILPEDAQQQKHCFVLTADTMGVDIDGVIHGKPSDTQDAIKKIKALRRGGYVGTAFCLDRKKQQNGAWVTEERVMQFVSATYEFDMPDEWIPKYFKEVPHYLKIAGAITIEGYGAQFLKSLNGSYTTILGLPMFEVREALERLGFF